MVDCKVLVVLGEEGLVLNEEYVEKSETKNACSKCHRGPYLNFTSSKNLFWDQGGKVKFGTVTQGQTLSAILEKIKTDRWKQQNPAHRIPGVVGVEAEMRQWLQALTLPP